MHAPLPLLIAGVTATTGLGIGSIAINTGALDEFGSLIEGTVTNVENAFATGVELAGPTKTKELSDEEPVEIVFAEESFADETGATDVADNSDVVNSPVVDPAPAPPTKPQEHGTSGGSATGQGDDDEDDDDDDDDGHEDHEEDHEDHEDHEDED